tara:strand:+ start:326 stop:1081 length:756 start_codon:yes stop_codon:yes gene_type:complete
MAGKIDNKAFQSMLTSSEADVTAANLFPKEDTGNKSSEAIHNALMTAGFTPGLGNIADAADALLYAFEGEFGDASWSAAAMLPFIGQAVSAKKAIKAAKEAGDEIITIHRGTDWHPARKKAYGWSTLPDEFKIKDTGESMVKGGKFVGGEYSTFNPNTLSYDLPKGTIWGSRSKKEAMEWGMKSGNTASKTSYILKFEIPKLELEKLKPVFDKGVGFDALNIGIPGGLPKKWLVKAEKMTDDLYMDIEYGK